MHRSAADIAFAYGRAVRSSPSRATGMATVSTRSAIYVPSTGAFFLTNTNASGIADITVHLRSSRNGTHPVVGDWDGDGTDTVGVYDPATGAFFLRNSNSGGPADLTFTFGGGGALQPLAGDWNDDGIDTIGLYTTASGVTFLRNSNTNGVADLTYQFGGGGGVACVGDFDGQ